MTVDIDIASADDWLLDMRNKDMSKYKEVESIISGWSDTNKKILFKNMTIFNLDFPDVSRKELLALIDKLVMFDDLPKSLMPESTVEKFVSKMKGVM